MSFNVFLAVVLFLASVGANACSFSIVSTSEISKTIQRHNGWNLPSEEFDSICERLAKGNANLNLTGSKSIIAGVMVAWTSVRLVDKDLPIFETVVSSSSTHTNSSGSPDTNVLDDIFYHSIVDAVRSLEIEAGIVELDKNRKSLYLAYSKNSR